MNYNSICSPIGCDCVTFDDTYNKEYGVFTSPNYPTQYEDSIDCLLYVFIADTHQIVKLSCLSGDFVKVFLNQGSGDTGVNEYSVWNSVLCGKSLDEFQSVHYSTGSVLIFEFHSDAIPNNSTGFSGTYQFVNKSLFQTDGQLLSGSQCDYQFVRLGANDSVRGTFYSPDYPSKYPTNANCAYHFFAKYNEKVKVLFQTIQLQEDDQRF
ncbi:unnamed protein product, partial [Medioppia subpectinata]